MLPVHDLPADNLFRLYVKDGERTRIMLWFRCSNNGDLVTRAFSNGRNLFEVMGNFDHGRFQPTTAPEKIDGLSGNDVADHLHLTFHPSIKKPTPVLNGIKRRTNIPRIDLRTLDRLQQVATHLLASPKHYPVEAPKPEKPGGQYHAVLENPYGPQQPRITFWVAPIQRSVMQVAERDVLPGCFIYARVSPKSLGHDLLLQVQQDTMPYSEYGDMHILAAPIV
ncbi:hypothetical protein [Denitratisoma oestradiolicum]|uniref:Uncharacterized protein n=1 Tax=Denitratisoma oestradiolicum TaxID=311182 RepID=A0A6S6Y246_9PROT|nr:hypothetical protein [Denitratisoma oestradiolicum]CAB1371011.1 conserved protein of unknown function [Denitratisoma oestradiolicum]